MIEQLLNNHLFIWGSGIVIGLAIGILLGNKENKDIYRYSKLINSASGLSEGKTKSNVKGRVPVMKNCPPPPPPKRIPNRDYTTYI